MPSLQRAIRRGNAVVYRDNILKTLGVKWKKGSERGEWKTAWLNRIDGFFDN
jgi:hypothetical protein